MTREASEIVEHEVIWLQPWCAGCEKHAYSGEGRMWCQDDVWDKCDECGAKSVRYTIARQALDPRP